VISEVWYLGRIMGTGIVQIEDTYARWLRRTTISFVRRLTPTMPCGHLGKAGRLVLNA
jgi:hypothetical protein